MPLSAYTCRRHSRSFCSPPRLPSRWLLPRRRRSLDARPRTLLALNSEAFRGFLGQNPHFSHIRKRVAKGREQVRQRPAEHFERCQTASQWESLQNYQVPTWYEDAKFGIFIHWGLYSVPAFANEWYSRNMYQPGSEEFKHHVGVLRLRLRAEAGSTANAQ
ncbi:MAG: alpha-L-fucosidase [Candidatus Sulfotelmatobacter sp.]